LLMMLTSLPMQQRSLVLLILRSLSLGLQSKRSENAPPVKLASTVLVLVVVVDETEVCSALVGSSSCWFIMPSFGGISTVLVPLQTYYSNLYETSLLQCNSLSRASMQAVYPLAARREVRQKSKPMNFKAYLARLATGDGAIIQHPTPTESVSCSEFGAISFASVHLQSSVHHPSLIFSPL
jgi:hypothetical protein